MFSFLRDIPLKRLLGYWLIMFVLVYATSFLLFGFLLVTENPFVYVTLQVLTPLSYLFFGWLYFRKVVVNTWSTRFFAAVVWIALTLAASAALIRPVYGADWTWAINTRVLSGQVLNVAAIIVAGFVASHRSRVEQPEGLI
mgnify:CR=1 FL=1